MVFSPDAVAQGDFAPPVMIGGVGISTSLGFQGVMRAPEGSTVVQRLVRAPILTSPR